MSRVAKLRWACFALFAIVFVPLGAVAADQPYPARPIHLISPNAAGGATTILAHLIGEHLTKRWGEAVVVENRGGGNGVIGGEYVARAAPDGYTIMLITTTHIITPLLMDTPYDAIKSFTPIATIGRSEQLLVVHPSVPAANLDEVVALARAKPASLNFASSGSGSSTHLAGELFNQVVGVKLQHVPYKGSGPALTDLIGGHVQMYFGPPSNVIPYIRGGQLKAIAIGGKARLAALPEVPTFNESGMPNVDIEQWWGIVGPAGMAKETVAKLAGEISGIVAMPEVQAKLVELGMEPFTLSPAGFGELMRANTDLFARVIKTSNIHLEN